MNRGTCSVLTICSALLIGTATNAATYRVDATGTIRSISNAWVDAPFSAGDNISLSFIYETPATRFQDNQPSNPGTELVYINILSSLSINWGGYRLTQNPNPTIFDQNIGNNIRINDDRPISAILRDAVFLRESVVPSDAGTATPGRFSINMQNTTGEIYDSAALTGSIFTNAALAGSNERAQFAIQLPDVGVSTAFIDSISTTEISVVPLPATGLLMLSGIGAFAAFRRRAC